MSNNTTTYTSSLTEEDLGILINDYFVALTDIAESSNNHVEFLRMQEDTVSMCATAFGVVTSIDLGDKLTKEEIEILFKLDLFGLLHLKPEESRDSSAVSIAIKKRMIGNKVYDYLLPEMQKLSRDLETTYLLQTSERLAQQNNNDMAALEKIISSEISVQGLSANEYSTIIKNIRREVQSFSRLISKTRSFEKILEDIKKATDLIAKIFTNEELRQTYEDIWISSHASEQSAEEFLSVVDDLSFLEFYYKSDKQDLSRKLEQLKNDKRFITSGTGDFKLLDKQKEYITNDITNVYKLFANREDAIKDYFRVIGFLSPAQIKSFINLVMLYTQLKNNSEKIYLEHQDITAIFTPSLITSIAGIEDLMKALDNSLASEDAVKSIQDISQSMAKVWINLSKMISANSNPEEHNSLNLFKNILYRINYSINASYFNGMDIFTNIEGKDSLFNLLVLLINNISLFYNTFIGDLAEIVKNVSSVNTGEYNINGIIQSIINSAESRANSQYQVASKLIAMDDQKFKELKVQRNNSLLQIIRREKKLSDEVSDHQGLMIGMFKLFHDNKFIDLALDDYNALIFLNNSNIDKLESVLLRISTEIAQKYSALVQELFNSGQNKNLTIIDLANSQIQEDKQTLFINLQQAIAHFKLFGFYFNTDSKYNFQVEEKKDIFLSYLNGWKTVFTPKS